MDPSPSPQQPQMPGVSATAHDDPNAGAPASGTGTDLGAGTLGMSRTRGEHARQAVERASASAHEAVDRIAGRAERFADRLDERSRRLTDAPLRALDYATHQVQTHPVQAVAISLAVGYVAGLLSGWRGASQRDYRD